MNNDTSMNNSQFSLANRKHLADLLGDYGTLRSSAKKRYRERVNKLRDSLVNEFAEKKGVTKVAAQIEAAESKIKDLTKELSVLGFYLDNGSVRLNYGSSNPLNKIIDERIDKELGALDAIDARFDSAQVAMMTVATLEDADKLLKSVAEI